MNDEYTRLGDPIRLAGQHPPLTDLEQTAFALASSMIPPLREYRNKVEAVENQCADTREAITSAAAELREIREDIAARKAEVAKLQAKIRKAEEDREATQKQVETLKKHKAGLEAQIGRSEQETDRLSLVLKQLGEDEAALRENIKLAEDVISDGNRNLRALKQNAAEVGKSISTRRADIETIETKPPSFILFRWFWLLIYGWSWRKEIKAGLEEIASGESRLAEIEAEIRKAVAGIERLDYGDKVQSSIRSVKHSIGKHKDEIAASKKNIETTKREVEKQEEIRSLLWQKPPGFILFRWGWMLILGWSWRKEVQEANSKIEDLESRTAEANDRISGATSDIEKLEYELALLVNIDVYRNKVEAIDRIAVQGDLDAEAAKRAEWTRKIASLPLNQAADRINQRNQEISELKRDIERQDVPGAEDNRVQNEEHASALERKLRDMEGDREDLQTIDRVVSGCACVGYPVLPVVVRKPSADSGHPGVTFFLDPMQATAREVKIPDLNIDQQRINEATEIINSFNEEMVFVTPDKEETRSFAKIDSVFGFEKRIKTAIQTLNDLAKESVPKDFLLPLVVSDSSFGKFIVGLLNGKSVGPASRVPVAEGIAAKLDELDNARNLVAALLRKAEDYDKIDGLLKGAEVDLKYLHEESSAIREKAGVIGTDMLMRAQENSILVRYHFYCPKCNVHPDYIEEFFKVRISDLGNFSRLPNERVKKMLKDFLADISNDETGKKMDSSSKNAIAESWAVAFSLLDKIHDDLERERRYGAERSQNDPLIKNLLHRTRRLYVNVYREIVLDLLFNPRVEFKKTLTSYYQSKKAHIEVLSRHPKNIFNENTRMQYLIETENWRCPNCENTFDKKTALLGAVDKIRKDIEVPAMTALWNDDEIWKKTVGLIENVSREIRDRWQQETDTLLTPIGEYKADIRELRGRIETFLNRGKAAQQRLVTMVDNYMELGIIDEKDAKKAKDVAKNSMSMAQSVEKMLSDMQEREDGMQELPSKISKMRETPSSPQTLLSSREAALSLFANSPSSKLLGVNSPGEDEDAK